MADIDFAHEEAEAQHSFAELARTIKRNDWGEALKVVESGLAHLERLLAGFEPGATRERLARVEIDVMEAFPGEVLGDIKLAASYLREAGREFEDGAIAESEHLELNIGRVMVAWDVAMAILPWLKKRIELEQHNPAY